MKKYILQGVIVWGAIGLLWLLFMYSNSKISDKEKEYQAKIDSLQIEIGLNKIKIDSLTSAKLVLDSMVAVNKGKLNEVSKKAETYRKKYNEEHTRISNMSNDIIISEFTAAFDYN